jgi:hypothetical protein
MGVDQTLNVIEMGLSPSEWQDTPNADPIVAFFDWVIASDRFGCVVVARARRYLRSAQPPLLIRTASDAANKRRFLEKECRAGFRAIIAVNRDISETIALLARLRYEEEGRGVVGGGGEHDPLGSAWNRDALSQALAMATESCGGHLCLFAHDGDPVYLIWRKL